MTEQGVFLQARDSSACFGINTTTTMPEGAPCSEGKAAPFLLGAKTSARGEKGGWKGDEKNSPGVSALPGGAAADDGGAGGGSAAGLAGGFIRGMEQRDRGD